MNKLTTITDRERELLVRLAEAERQRDVYKAQVEVMRSKVYSATICHPNGVQFLLEEALATAQGEHNAD